MIDSAACWEAAYRAVARSDGARLRRGHLAALAGAAVASACTFLDRVLATAIDEDVLRNALTHAFDTHDVLALPGAHDLLAALSPTLSLGVATNGPLDLVERALERVGLRRHLRTVVSDEGVARQKPAPDVYLEMAVTRRRPNAGLAVHSDQGSQGRIQLVVATPD